MSKVILVTKPADLKSGRRCLNCGRDISDKRKDAEFCCSTCRISYRCGGRFPSRYYN